MKLSPDTLKYIQTLSPDDRRKFLAYLKDADVDVQVAEELDQSVSAAETNPLSDNPFGVNLVEEILNGADDA